MALIAGDKRRTNNNRINPTTKTTQAWPYPDSTQMITKMDHTDSRHDLRQYESAGKRYLTTN